MAVYERNGHRRSVEPRSSLSSRCRSSWQACGSLRRAAARLQLSTPTKVVRVKQFRLRRMRGRCSVLEHVSSDTGDNEQIIWPDVGAHARWRLRLCSEPAYGFGSASIFRTAHAGQTHASCRSVRMLSAMPAPHHDVLLCVGICDRLVPSYLAFSGLFSLVLPMGSRYRKPLPPPE